MTDLNLVYVPDPRLREVCTPVSLFDGSLRKLGDDMLETMYHEQGIGLAGPQVGAMQRILVLDVAREDEAKQPMVLVNPQIIWSSEGLSSYQEGCLSLPGQYAEVTRPAEVRVKYSTTGGEERELQAAGLLATCVQHEIDHLNGVLFIDYLSRLKRDMILRRLAKQQKLSG
jgi:peptide deformylase